MSIEPPEFNLSEQEISSIIKKYSTPVKYPKRVMEDANTGNKYNFITFDGLMAEPTYVNKQLFNYAGTKFVFKNKATGAIFEYDIQKETITYIDKATCLYVAPTDVIYYCKDGELWKMDWSTYKKEYMCNTPINEYLLVSTNEKYASGTSNIQSFGKTGRQNLTTGEVEWIEHDFSENPHTCGIGHTNVNPGYPEYLFFCNEGVTTHIPDRLWMHNYQTNQTYNFFVQAGPEGSIETQETSGHEAWNMTGEYMYWVKYCFEGNLGQSGLMRKNKEGTVREYINGDYSHWHCYPSGDDNWVVSDINNREWGKAADIGGCTIALTNTNTYESWPIAYFEPPFGNHPYHPHPHINYGSTVVQWGMVDENNILGIAWMDVSHLTKDGRCNKLIPVDDKLTIVTNEKYGQYRVSQCEYQNKNCYSVEPLNKMYIKVENSYAFTPKASKVTLGITYFDDGNDSFNIVYTSAAQSRMDLADRENKSISVEKTNTKEWKTQMFVVDNMALNDRCSHQTDFAICNNSDQLLYINKISINV